MCTNFSEWRTAVFKEYRKLADVEDYLTEDGTARLHAFDTLDDLAEFYGSCSELVDGILSPDAVLSDGEREDLASHHLIPALRRLRELAAAETQQN